VLGEGEDAPLGSRGVQRNRPLTQPERVVVGIAAAILCGACTDRLAIDLGRLGLGDGLQVGASAIALIAFLVALPYGLSKTLETVHFAAALLAVTFAVFVLDALFS
jgi:hypothetical protein